MDRRKDTAVEAVLEQLIEHGPGEIASVFARAFELAMQIERERFLGAGLYERTPARQGYANGYKAKRIDTPAGTVSVQGPKTAGHDGDPFYPRSLERGRRSVRAVMLAVAEMYIKGVSTRQAGAVMREFGVVCLSSSQVSRAARLLDDELEAWRIRPLGEVKYLMLDARLTRRCAMVGWCATPPCYRPSASARTSGGGCWACPSPSPKPRSTGGASSRASSPAVCAGSSSSSRTVRHDGRHRSEAHGGRRAARRPARGARRGHLAALSVPPRPRHAIHHAPNAEIRKCIGKQMKSVWNADDLARAETALAELVASYRDTAPKLATWLEENVPEGLAVFTLPEHHRRRLRTSDPMERAVQQELKRRTAKVRVFPGEESLLRLVSAILVEIDEKWAADTKAYIKWECQDA